MVSRTSRKSGDLKCDSIAFVGRFTGAFSKPGLRFEGWAFFVELWAGKMKELFLIRHGATEQSEEPRYVGRLDIGLSVKGRGQAKLVAERLRGESIETIFSSPLSRSLETAKAIAQNQQLEVEVVQGLSEIDFGQWEGLTFEQIGIKSPEQVNSWLERPEDFVFPGGESVKAFHERVIEAVEKHVLIAAGPTIVVGHGGSLRAIICHLCRWPVKNFFSFTLDCTGVSILEHYGDMTIVKTLNDTSHLRAEE